MNNNLLKTNWFTLLLLNLTVWLLVVLILSTVARGQDESKIAQTGLQFLSVVSDARAAALANTMTSLEEGSGALFFNPATMGFMTSSFDVSFSLNEWIADINHHNVSLAFSPGNGNYGVFGFSLQAVDYGEVLGTIVAANEKGYEDVGIIEPSAFAFGVGYAKALSEQFSVGGQVKWVRQDLGESIIPATDSSTTRVENVLKLLAFDFGTLYKTGFKSLAFGFSARNFSQETEFAQESFQLPLVFSLGVSMNLLDFTRMNPENQALLFTFQATNARSHPEQVSFAMEYQFMELISLRGGFVTNNDEDDISFGFGVSHSGLKLDYAYTPFGVFDKVQRFTARFSL